MNTDLQQLRDYRNNNEFMLRRLSNYDLIQEQSGFSDIDRAIRVMNKQRQTIKKLQRELMLIKQEKE